MTENSGKENKLFNIPKVAARYAAYKWYDRKKNTRGMYHNYKYLESVNKNKPNYFFHLSKLAYDDGNWERSLHYVNKAIELQTLNEKKQYFFHKGEVLIKQNKEKEALVFLEEYLKYTPNDIEANLTLGEKAYKQKEWIKAVKGFEGYLKYYSDDIDAISKVANCYRFIEEYKNAEHKYEQLVERNHLIKNKQRKAEAYYLLGLMKLYNNSKRDISNLFDKCMYYDEIKDSEHLGIGVFHEKFYQYDKAIRAYKRDLQKNKENYLLLYQLGSLLDKLNNIEEAIPYYHDALQLYKVEASWHYALGLCYEKISDFKNAALCYKNASDRYLNHNEEAITRYANALNHLGETRKSLEAYQEADLFKKTVWTTNAQFKNNVNKKAVRYAIYYEYYKVENNIIFYESLSGGRMMGNPYAIFEQILYHEDFKNFIHVWVVNSFSVIPKEYQDLDNVIYVKKESDAYAKYISKAKYLICNSTLAPFVTRKPNQLYLQTSHGIFYKTVGRDSAETPLGVAGATRNLLQATHIIVPNEFMAKKQPESYSIEGIHTGEIAKVGYPRIDVTKSASEEKRTHIKSRLDINCDKKTVVYAPTWRGITKSRNRFDTEKLISDLKLMGTLDINVVFRGHPISNRLLSEVEMPDNIILPPPDIQTNELLNIADITISDYSSLFFDFLVTERPIIHYLYDVEEYTKERGLNLSESELPGAVAKDIYELIQEIKNKLQNPLPSLHYLKAKERFSPYDDGHSSERVIKWFFYGETDEIDIVDKKNYSEAYLVLAGKLSDKESTNNLVAYLNNLIKEEKSVSVMISKEVIKNKDKFNSVMQMDGGVNFIVHDANTPHTVQEIAAIASLKNKNKYFLQLLEDVKNTSFKREARRLVGNTHFDYVINFETQNYYWNELEKALK